MKNPVTLFEIKHTNNEELLVLDDDIGGYTSLEIVCSDNEFEAMGISLGQREVRQLIGVLSDWIKGAELDADAGASQ